MKARRGGGIKQSFINLSHFPPIGVVVLPFFLLHATVFSKSWGLKEIVLPAEEEAVEAASCTGDTTSSSSSICL